MKETMKRWARVFRRGKQTVWMGRNRFSESILEQTEGGKKKKRNGHVKIWGQDAYLHSE